MVTEAPTPLPSDEADAQLPPKVASTTSTTIPSSTPSAVEDDATSSIRRTPFADPSNSTTVPEAPTLTEEQSTKYNSLYNTVCTWTSLPNASASNAPSSPLTETEQMWLSRECLLRYLRATNWNVAQSATRLRNTLIWRREYGVYTKLTPEYISIENETGKQWILGYDYKGRPCQYLNPSRQNTEKSDRQIEHLVFMLEMAIDVMPPGQETLALLMNFAETRNGQSASFAQGRQALNILQNHYPERLGRALLTNLPWHISAFMRLVFPFIDPKTKEKIVFNEDMRKHVPPEQLTKSHGGDLEFEYEHEVYWSALLKLAEERRQLRYERWVKGGKMIGEIELYMKGGQEESLRSTTNQNDEIAEKMADLAVGEKGEKQNKNVKVAEDAEKIDGTVNTADTAAAIS